MRKVLARNLWLWSAVWISNTNILKVTKISEGTTVSAVTVTFFQIFNILLSLKYTNLVPGTFDLRPKWKCRLEMRYIAKCAQIESSYYGNGSLHSSRCIHSFHRTNNLHASATSMRNCFIPHARAVFLDFVFLDQIKFMSAENERQSGQRFFPHKVPNFTKLVSNASKLGKLESLRIGVET